MINRFAVMSSSLCAFIASTSVFAEVPPIEKIAPENSIIVVGTRNTAQAMENVKKTGLWAMWQSEKMTTLRADQMKEMDEQIKKMMTDLGVEEDSLVCPTGAAGLALFTIVDPDIGTPEMAVIAYADYGGEADKTDNLIKAALAQGSKDGKLEYEEKDIAGRNVFAIDLSKLQPAEEPAEDDFGGGMPGLPIPSPEDVMKGLTKVNYVRDGSTLMISSDMTALTDALDAIDGKGDAGGAGKFAAREDFQNTIEQVGGEGDMYAVLMTRDVMDLMGEGGMMMAMFRPTIRALTGEVAGYAANMRFESGSAMVEQTFGAYMPSGKKGLTALMDKPGPRSDVPAFVAGDSTSFTSMNFDFSGLMAVVKDVINSNPMLAGQAAEVMDQVEPMMTPIFNALGGKMVMAGSGAGSLMAFECKDPQGFENGFAALAAQAGMESRDFLGQRIYTMKEGIPMELPGMGGGGAAEPMSIGIGGGFVYMGATPGVEGALRATGNADAPTLAKNEAFQKAVAALGNEPVVGWGYMDFVTGFDDMIRSQNEQTKAAIEQVKEFDPDMAAEMEKEMADSAKMLESINSEFLKQYIGPSVWQARSNDKGFIMNWLVLPAVK